jgi:H+/Cl- antiporter ClcA
LVGVAVKVTDVPGQIVPAGTAATVTEGTKAPVTDIVIAFEVAGEPVAQSKLVVITQVITSPFTRVVVV